MVIYLVVGGLLEFLPRINLYIDGSSGMVNRYSSPSCSSLELLLTNIGETNFSLRFSKKYNCIIELKPLDSSKCDTSHFLRVVLESGLRLRLGPVVAKRRDTSSLHLTRKP